MVKLAALLAQGIIAAILAAAWVDARAEIYKYTDDRGVPHFVDSPSKIPPAYRAGHELHKSLNQHLTAPAQPAAEPGSFSAPPPGTADFREWHTPVAIIGGQVLVPVILGYGGREVNANLLLDTGASTILLDHRFSSELAIRKFAKSVGRVADGSLITTEMAKLDYARIGPFQVADLAAAFIKSKDATALHDGLLGMNFLRHFNYSIDFDNRVITWTP